MSIELNTILNRIDYYIDLRTEAEEKGHTEDVVYYDEQVQDWIEEHKRYLADNK